MTFNNVTRYNFSYKNKWLLLFDILHINDNSNKYN